VCVRARTERESVTKRESGWPVGSCGLSTYEYLCVGKRECMCVCVHVCVCVRAWREREHNRESVRKRERKR